MNATLDRINYRLQYLKDLENPSAMDLGREIAYNDALVLIAMAAEAFEDELAELGVDEETKNRIVDAFNRI